MVWHDACCMTETPVLEKNSVVLEWVAWCMMQDRCPCLQRNKYLASVPKILIRYDPFIVGLLNHSVNRLPMEIFRSNLSAHFVIGLLNNSINRYFISIWTVTEEQDFSEHCSMSGGKLKLIEFSLPFESRRIPQLYSKNGYPGRDRAMNISTLPVKTLSQLCSIGNRHPNHINNFRLLTIVRFKRNGLLTWRSSY